MRHHALLEYLTGLPLFAAYFALGLLLLGAFVFIYVRLTPYREIGLIRAGNSAAAASLGGAIVGFVLPVASSIENSVSLVDMLLWALISLVVQLLAFVIARAMIPTLSKNVQDGQLASGVFLGAVAIALGLLNAACMTY
jgi:putative membrane protein